MERPREDGRRGWTRTSDPQLRRPPFLLSVTRVLSHLQPSPVQVRSRTVAIPPKAEGHCTEPPAASAGDGTNFAPIFSTIARRRSKSCWPYIIVTLISV